MPPATASPSGDHTRVALIHAGLKLFGENGFDGTSTRQIAMLANANVGSIAYHFGGKEGLRIACADHIVDTARAIAAQALQPLDGDAPDEADPDAARRMLHGAVENMVRFIVARPEAGAFVQFILRELAHPSPALDRIYEGVFAPIHVRLCVLWSRATGEPADAERTKLTVFTLVGQVVYFRIARLGVLRRLGWGQIGDAQAAAIADVTHANLDAVLAKRSRRVP